MRALFLLLINLISTILCGNVLFLPSTLYPVHSLTMSHLANELSNRGHQITWLEIGPQQSKTVLQKSVNREFWPAKFNDQTLSDIFTHRNHSQHSKLWDVDFNNENEQTTGWLASIRLCDSVLSKSKDKFDKLVQQKFDTIVVDDLYNPCGILLAGLKKSVYVYWSMTSMRTESAWANQSPSPPSYLPAPGTGLTDDLSFTQRIYNVASYFKNLYIHQHIVQPRIDAVFQKYYPGVESTFNIERNASINLVNNPPIFDFARPYMPRVNFVGGLHCKKAGELSKEYSDFIENSGKGFILLTTGFTAQWKNAPEEIKQIYISTFKSLPNFQFIWQYNGLTINGLPKNVLIKSWVPQQDLLGNSKCLAHVSHGGLNSVIESVYHGVPVVGLPLTTRAYDNLLRVTARDSGILIEKSDFSTESLKNALVEVIENEKFKKEMLIFQDMVIDVPYTELYHAAFWVEFIERHQEVPHARSGADKLNVFQYFLVDVIAFFFFVIYCTIASIYFVIRSIFRAIRYVFSSIGIVAKKSNKVSKSKKSN
ncbi:unnamed protein product [Caenorhabditis angaria]|uniref:glucuronosyltransferase n=1 Tax=Caenorhabditis angaria TaxID=860376 RepID=A0A9P1ID36_9PELO|nr:unnamed protein product [Caenorhabditis angaria]